MFRTKTDKGRRNAEFFGDLTRRALHIRLQRIAGYPVNESQMTAAEFHTLLMLERFIESEEIDLKRQTTELMTKILSSR